MVLGPTHFIKQPTFHRHKYSKPHVFMRIEWGNRNPVISNEINRMSISPPTGYTISVPLVRIEPAKVQPRDYLCHVQSPSPEHQGRNLSVLKHARSARPHSKHPDQLKGFARSHVGNATTGIKYQATSPKKRPVNADNEPSETL